MAATVEAPITSEEEPTTRPGLSWVQALLLAAATCFLGYALSTFLTSRGAPGSSSVEVGFAQDMITHHEQAIEMASLVVSKSESPVVRSFGKEILLFQSYEIGLMDGWLKDWGYRREDRPAEAMAWMGAPVDVRSMPGLAGEAEIESLEAAQGADADAMFLTLMAAHHRGGLHMARHASEHTDDAQVRDLATRMARNQALEVNEYAQTAIQLGLDVDIAIIDTTPFDAAVDALD